MSNVTETVNSKEKVEENIKEKKSQKVKEELPLETLSDNKFDNKKWLLREKLTKINVRNLALSVFVLLLLSFSFLTVLQIHLAFLKR